MKYQAHRGVSSENPENTMPAFIAAVEQGYDIIETDVSITKDMQFVLLHDSTLNRTARNVDKNELNCQIDISEILYEQALTYDFGAYFSIKFESTKIVLLKELLEYLKDKSVKLKIDNKFCDFTLAQKQTFFELIKPYEEFVELTCRSAEELLFVNDIFPEMHFHYDGIFSESVLEKISEFVFENRLTVWLPYSDISNIKAAKSFGDVGIWQIDNYSRFDEVVALGADIVETNGIIKPIRNSGVVADMHTHSKFSHDSTELIENTYSVQKERGTQIFAVTDHCDTFEHANGDTFEYIAQAFENVAELNNNSDGCVKILSGVEMGEGFWYPDAARMVEKMKPYDVILGSVHVVKADDGGVYPYSGMDFSRCTTNEINRFLDNYFRDMRIMLDTRDFDVLTHLTCPLRYICGKYGHIVDLTPYYGTIKEILKSVIERGIALEVNTSSFGMINNFMPDENILHMYYDMGGYLITLGSDAHIASNASMFFSDAVKSLKKIGFRNIFFFENRKCYQCSL